MYRANAQTEHYTTLIAMPTWPIRARFYFTITKEPIMKLVPTLIALAYNSLIDMSAIGGQVQKYNDKAFEAAAGSSYLPYVNLMTSQSDECKMAKFPINHFALHASGDPVDLGGEVDLLPIAWRPKAMDISGKAMIVSYDQDSAEFKGIMTRSAVANSKCMYGIEFLCWLPKQTRFITFYFSSKSSRKEAPGMKSRIGKACTVKPKLCQTSEYTWFVPTVFDCNVPFDLPTMEDIKDEVEKFNNPPKSLIEKAPETPAEGGRER
jgi:hypothetical protein